MKENKFTTDLPEMMVGMYAAEDIRRSWTEDFVDEDKGEVVPYTRSELIIERAFYQLDTIAAWRYNGFHEAHLFICLARDVDEARCQIEDWIDGIANDQMRRLAEEGKADDSAYKRYAKGFDLSVLSGTKIPCTATVPKELSSDFYAEQELQQQATDNK